MEPDNFLRKGKTNAITLEGRRVGGAKERIQAARCGPRRSVLRGGTGDGRPAVGHVEPRGAAGPLSETDVATLHGCRTDHPAPGGLNSAGERPGSPAGATKLRRVLRARP